MENDQAVKIVTIRYLEVDQPQVEKSIFNFREIEELYERPLL